MNNWLKITQDPWILQTISGYRINFDEQPYQEHVPREIDFSQEELLIYSTKKVKEIVF